MSSVFISACVCLYCICVVSIESTGALAPNILMEEAVKILKGKCEAFLKELSELT